MAMQPHGSAGIEVGQRNLGAGDFVPPRVKVLQPMSQESVDEKGKPGDFYNTLTGQAYGTKVRVVPLFTFMNRVFIVRADKKAEADAKLVAAGMDKLPEGDGLMCRSIDMMHGVGDPGTLCDQCPMAQWEGRTKAPLCAETYNLAALTERGEVVFLQMAKSSAKVGKKMNSALRFRSAQPWATFWDWSTTKEQNDRGTFYTPDFAITDEDTPPELLSEARRFVKMFEGQSLDTTEDIARDEAAATPTDLPF